MPKRGDTNESGRMLKITDGLPTKSAKIRALDDAAYSRSEIARFLDIRNQHVRNVLVGPRPKNESGRVDPTDSRAADDGRQMAEITDGLPTKAAKIRALLRDGFDRVEITKFLKIRYQQVYNVEKRSALAEESAGFGRADVQQWVKVGADGCISIPAVYCHAMGLKEGSEVQVSFENGEVRVVPRDVVIRRVRDRVRKYVPEGVSLVDELIAERRREADGEERDA